MNDGNITATIRTKKKTCYFYISLENDDRLRQDIRCIVPLHGVFVFQRNATEIQMKGERHFL